MSDDLFGQPTRSAYPKVEDLEGMLLLIKPIRIEVVPNRFDRDGTKPTVERATADVVVFGPEGYEEYGDMYLSQAVLLSACKNGLKPGAKPFVLGRLVKVATKETQEKLKIDNSPEAFATARQAWIAKGGKGTEPKHVWVLDSFTDEDAGRARAYVTEKAKATDPFATADA
jgi:hypothetical protein